MFLDQSTDLDGRQTYRLTKIIDFPAFVKSASEKELNSSPDTDYTDFADLKRRQYPTHTAAATWLSFAFFEDQKSKYNTKEAAFIEAKLKQRAAFHNISRSVEKLQEKFAQFNSLPDEDKLPDDCFALVYTEPDGSKVRKYPIRNPSEVKEAEQYYIKYRDNMPFDKRQLFAHSVLEKAASFGIKLDNEEPLIKSAGRGACSAQDAAKLLLDRVLISKRPGKGVDPVQEELLKLAKTCCTKPSQVRTPEGLQKIANVVDQFDKTYKLTKYYDGGLDRPEDVLFSITKEALESFVYDNVETTTGNLYKMADFENIKTKDIRECLGDDYAEATTLDGIHADAEKLARVVKTMPRDDASLFDVFCTEKGIRPWGQSKAAFEFKLDHAALKKLAELR